MPVPTQDTAIAAEGVALLTSRYLTAPVVSGITKALMQRIQDLENQFWSLLNGVIVTGAPLPGGPWSIYDQLAALVGTQGRQGLSDSDLLKYILLQARVNRSRGLSEDILKLARVINQSGQPIFIDVTSPCAFYLFCSNIALFFGGTAIAQALLSQARPLGIAGDFVYTTWAPGNDFAFSDGSGRVPFTGFGTFGDGRFSNSGGLLAAGARI